MSLLKKVKDKRFKVKAVMKYDIAKLLKTYRKKNKLSQEALANQIKMSRQVIARWEINYSYPSNLSIQLLKINKIL